MEAKLVVVGGKANKSEVKLKLPAMIGRSRDADVTVSHASVSRHHCLVYELEGALVVRDNGSLNGTVIDGERIHESLLKPGQSLTIGPLTFRADYEHDGEFPIVGAAPSGSAESNGEAAKSKSHAMPASPERKEPEPALAAAAGDDEPPPVESEAAEAMPDGSADGEPSADSSAPGGFDFLDEEPAASPASSAPSFGFLKAANDAPTAAGDDDDDDDDSAALFRIADGPAPAATKPSAAKPAAKLAEKASPRTQPAEKSAAVAKSDDDPALNDFLNSLGLEE